MIELIESLPLSIKLLMRDKKALALALIPIVIGILLLVLFGGWIVSTAIPLGQQWIQAHVVSSLEGVATFFLGALVIVVVLLGISWVFVLLVGIIAGPFNDFLSERIENNLKDTLIIPETKKRAESILRWFLKLWIHELKKFIFVLMLSVLALIIGLVPLLTPLALALSGLVISINFLSYSWSRHDWSFSQIVSDLKGHILPYILSGALWGFLVTIPVVNLFVLPLGVVFYTILWSKLNLSKKQM